MHKMRCIFSFYPIHVYYNFYIFLIMNSYIYFKLCDKTSWQKVLFDILNFTPPTFVVYLLFLPCTWKIMEDFLNTFPILCSYRKLIKLIITKKCIIKNVKMVVLGHSLKQNVVIVRCIATCYTNNYIQLYCNNQ